MKVEITIKTEPRNWFEKLFGIRRNIKGLKKEDLQIAGGEIMDCNYINGKYIVVVNNQTTGVAMINESVYKKLDKCVIVVKDYVNE